MPDAPAVDPAPISKLRELVELLERDTTLELRYALDAVDARAGPAAVVTRGALGAAPDERTLATVLARLRGPSTQAGAERGNPPGDERHLWVVRPGDGRVVAVLDDVVLDAAQREAIGEGTIGVEEAHG